MKCEICHKSPPNDNIALYRVNEFGVKGIWRCYADLTEDQKKNIDPIEHDIVTTIVEHNKFNKNK